MSIESSVKLAVFSLSNVFMISRSLLCPYPVLGPSSSMD